MNFPGITQWCSLCNSAPADGTLIIEDPVTKDPVPLPACKKCVDDIPEENWI